MNKIKCLITAGPTREFFDPVRFISNPSTGKMGMAIAEAANALGWDVTLILGPTNLAAQKNIKTINVQSADDMLSACQKEFPSCDILIMTAAVSDMRPKIKNTQKVKKDALSMTVEFEPTPDILKTLSQSKDKQILIGFAAETENVKEYALKKLKEKNLDAICANSVANPNSGFASDFNSISIISKDGSILEIPHASKTDVAKKLIAELAKKYFNA